MESRNGSDVMARILSPRISIYRLEVKQIVKMKDGYCEADCEARIR